MRHKGPYLLVGSANAPEKAFPLLDKPFYIGRLPENDVTLRDVASSRRHCKIEPFGNGHRLIDFASSNGTYVNGLRVTEKVLDNLDVIQIGKTNLVFHDPRGGAVASSSKPPRKRVPRGKSVSAGACEISPDESRFLEKPRHQEAQGFYLLFQLGRLLVAASDLTPLLQTALALIVEHFGAQRGCLALVDGEASRSGAPLPLNPVVTKITDPIVSLASPDLPSASISQRVLREGKAVLTHDALVDPRFSAEPSIAHNTVRSALCAPLIIQEKSLGVVYLDHLGEKHVFAEIDLDLLTAVANLLAVAISQAEMRKELQREALIRANLERFHSPDVVKSILRKTSSDGTLGREVLRTEATILFSDIKGFTSLSEELEPEEIALLLNNYLNKMTQIIFQHRGTVNKYIGDAVMAIFGAPAFPPHLSAPELAIRAAIDMQSGLKSFLNHIAPHKRFQMRIGINTGIVVAGYIGAEKHLEYTVLGDAVNIASRLESICEPGGILVGARTHEVASTQFQFQSRGKTKIKGKRNVVETFQVVF